MVSLSLVPLFGILLGYYFLDLRQNKGEALTNRGRDFRYDLWI